MLALTELVPFALPEPQRFDAVIVALREALPDGDRVTLAALADSAALREPRLVLATEGVAVAHADESSEAL